MQRDNTSGLTLLEILIALSIFTIALLAMVHMQITAMRTNAFANRVTTATTWAHDKMEELKGLSYSGSQLLVGTHPTGSDPNPDLGIYTRQWSVQQHTVTGAKTVAVTVSWDNWSHQVQLDTIIIP